MFKFDSTIIKSSVIAISIAISAFSFNAQAALNNGIPDNYQFTNLGNGDLYIGSATAINDVGQIVGFSYGLFGGYKGLLWNTSNGTTTNLGASVATDINNYGHVVGSGGSNPYVPLFWEASNASPVSLSMNGNSTIYGGAITNAINNSGKAVGQILTNTGQVATIWDTSTNTSTMLGNLGSYGGTSNAFAKDINNAGLVVGFGNDSSNNGYYQALMWDTVNGTATSLGDLLPSVEYASENQEFRAGWGGSEANAINASGFAVGNANFIHEPSTGGYSHGMLWDTTNHTVVGLDYLAVNTHTYANDINDAGLIVGESGGIATLWSDGSVYNLNSFLDQSTRDAGWVLTTANGINSNGWIVGNATNVSQGLYTAFLLAPVTVPVPEPETYAMILAGLGLMGFVARRQKKNQA